MKKIINLFLLITSFNLVATNNIPTKTESTIKHMRDTGIKYIQYIFYDFLGAPKSVIRLIESLENDLRNGIFVDGSSIRGCNRITESDMLLIPDLDTVRIVPWTTNQTKTATIICNMHVTKEHAYQSDPRCILQKAIEKLRTMGYEFIVGTELEFYVFNPTNNIKNLTPCDYNGYIDNPYNCNAINIQTNTLNILRAFDLGPQKIHHEVAPGQWEIVFDHDAALTMADIISLAKHALKSIGDASNLRVSFMPKPLLGQNGSGMHMHFSLLDLENKTNAFYQSDDPQYLSPLAKSFIAGILLHTREIALLLNPTVNSYKRLVRGFEAPVFICCGTKNRSALIRLPQINPDDANAARAEIRCPDAQCNPYLAIAALIQAGIDGINKQLQLDHLINENLYELDTASVAAKGIELLPTSLEEAIELFEQSNFVKEFLGEHLFTIYLNEKKKEALAYKRAITDWELERYL